MALAVELVDALKRLLKAHGLTYAAVAQRLAISEGTVKRMFAQRSLSLQRLDQICGVLQIGLTELAEEAQRGLSPLAELSLLQEQALVDDSALLLALYLVLNRWRQQEVLARYRFSEAEWTLLLARLDRLGIIELLPGNRVRSRTARNFRWRRNGPMQRFFQQRLLPEYFQRDFADDGESLLLLSGMLSKSSIALMQRRLHEIAAEFDQLMAQDAALPANQRAGVSLVLAIRPWSLSMFAEHRRS